MDILKWIYLGQACMDAVVNPPRPGEASYESWDAEVQGVLASLKESIPQIFKLKILPER